MANCVACSLIQSRLDYANSQSTGMSSVNFDKRRWIQNARARVVALSKKRDHISPILERLYWLPIRHRVDYKVSLLTYKIYKIRQSGELEHLRTLLSDYVPTWNFRSAERNDLVIPRTKLVIVSRVFCVAAPRLWNSLSHDVQTPNSCLYSARD